MSQVSIYGSEIPFVVPRLDSFAFETHSIDRDSNARVSIAIAGDANRVRETAMSIALICHYPNYDRDSTLRTRITIICDKADGEDLRFEFAELFDNSWWRTIDLNGDQPKVTLHRPQSGGKRKEFVDIEWEFVESRLSNPILQERLQQRAADKSQELTIVLCYDDEAKNISVGEKLSRRLGNGAKILVDVSTETDLPPTLTPYGRIEDVKTTLDRLMALARYLNYFYQASYSLGGVPVELPESEVSEAWEGVATPKLQRSNLYNAMTMQCKMRTLGHKASDLSTFYALSADEIESLIPAEHNRWSVERLIQGFRPCTDEELEEIARDRSLKKQYKNERGAHSDLVAFADLQPDETGLSVVRYDRDLIAAIPLIVSTYEQRNN